ncbi:MULTISPECIES: Ig-like domain-containing protein [unclassified Blastococcus]
MAGLRTALARRRRLLSGGSVTLAALTLAGFALVDPGTPTAEVELNDAGVWVTNGDELLVGRLNGQIGELDGAVVSPAGDPDVVQEGGTVFAVDSGGGALQSLDVAFVSLDDPVDLRPGSTVALGGGRLAVTDPVTGDVWVRDAGAIGALAVDEDAPTLTLGPEAVVAVGPTGVVAGVSPEDDELVVLDPDGGTATVPLGRDVDQPQVTVVGDRAVVLDPERAQLVTGDGDVLDLDDEGTAVLQQPGPASAGVLVGTDAALWEVPLDGGGPARLADGTGGPVAPVRVAGCAHAAWSGDPSYAQDCGAAGRRQEAIPGAEPGARLSFRVNRDRAVLNDLDLGTVWLLDEDGLTVADNWDEVRPPDPDDTNDEQSDSFDEAETLDRTAQNRPPVAQADAFGARPGVPTLLPVLDNDSDPDGDLLVVNAVREPDASRGTVTVVQGGSRLQFTSAPGATGAVTFSYAVDDGRGGVDEAEVTVTIRPWDVNAVPQLKPSARARTVVVLGGTVVHQVLGDWIDPDGDELTLVSATTVASAAVRSTADGLVTFVDAGTEPGLKPVALRIGDGIAEVDGALSVEVRPEGDLPPTARGDHVTAFAGETVVVSPLANDSDPNGDELRLSAVPPTAETAVVPDYVAGTFAVSSARVGTHYLVYTVAAGPATAEGLVRLDVLAGGTNTPPVAVRDLALVPPARSTTVDALANDVDVDGDVLVLTGVTVSQGSGLRVSVQDHRFLTIAADALLQRPQTITYTVSDGTASVQGAVVVRSVPPSATDQPPITAPDTATVRAGDVLTLDVLANDSDPDGDELTLLPELTEHTGGGTVTVVGNRLHVLAPDGAGTVRAVYQVADPSGQRSSSQVTLYVRARDDQNSPPTPKPLTGRVFAGGSARIEVPLTGIDPDGDSVRLVGVGSAPTRGRVVEVAADHLVYEAYGETGTDSFTYVVEDGFGVPATGTVRVGIAQRPAGNQPPVAQADSVTTRPGRAVTVDVLANDADPDGDQLVIGGEFPEAGDLDVRLSGTRVRVVAPQSGEVTVAYTVEDGRGGEATGYLTVRVDPAAPPQPPVAVDDVVSTDVLVPGAPVPVAVLDNDRDPDGSAEDLTVSVDGGDAVARVDGDGRVLVTAAPTRQTVRYTVTDVDGLSAGAVVLVPGAQDLPPRLRAGLALEVGAEGATWQLDELVEDPEGADVRLTGRVLSATRSDGSPLAEGATALHFTPAPGVYGPASLTFEVTDGAGPEGRQGRTAVLTVPIRVVTDVPQPPAFPGASLTVAIGEGPATLDLEDLVTDPDGGTVRFGRPNPDPAGFVSSLDGNVLRVEAAPGAPAGTVGRLMLAVTDDTTDPQPAPVDLVLVSSSRPLAQAVADTAVADQGERLDVAVLANDVNPYPGEPLVVESARRVSGDAEVGVSGDRVTVTPGARFVGEVTVEYVVRDRTGDAAREVRGLLAVTVRGAPDQPAAPTVLEVRNATVVLSWPSPVANGAPITGYRVEGSGVSQDCPTTTCTIAGLRNGDTYTFTVTARNEVGDSPASPASGPARPDTRPDPPAPPALRFGDGSLDVTWAAPRNEGSAISGYDVEISPGGAAVRVVGTSHTFTGLTNGQSYQVRVRAVNSAPEPSEWSGYSAPEVPAGVPDAPAAPTAAPAGAEVGGSVRVSWTAPADNGAPIDGYRLAIYRNGALEGTQQFPGGQTSTDIQAQNANDYTFALVAVNKAGPSAESPRSAVVRAFGAPAAVGAVSATPGDGSATLAFEAPSDNGQAISRYEVQVNGSGAAALPANRVVTGLSNGADYSFAVRACNTYCGAWSAPSNTVRPFGPPPAPAVVNASGSWKTVSFSWSASSTNGRPIARYEISVDGGGWQDVGGATSYGPVGNGYSQSHSIQVRAVDSGGLAGPARGATGNTSSPTVSVYRGASAVGVGTCTHSSCGYIVVEVHGMQPGSYEIGYGSTAAAGGDLNATDNFISVDGAGNGVRDRPKYFGFPGQQVWATVDGVTSPRYTWPN